MTRWVASPLGVLEPSHSRHRVGRGRPDEEVTRIFRAQPSPDSETGTHAAFIQGFQKGSALSLATGEVTIRFRRFAQSMTANP